MTRNTDNAVLHPDLQATTSLLQRLEAWAAQGWLRELDARFARFLADEITDIEPLALLAATLASHQLGRGHVCLDLAQTLADPYMALSLPPDSTRDDSLPLVRPAELLAGIELAQWQRALAHPDLSVAGAGNTPLVLAGQRLYLRRYWQDERDVEAGIRARLSDLAPAIAASGNDQPGTSRTVDPLETPETARLAAILDLLFPPAGETTPGRPHDAATDTPPDWQRVACALAARSRFALITGGPGTGKTTTVVRLLALLQCLALDPNKPDARPLRIKLAAPTGKAATRLNAAIAGALERLDVDALPASQPVRPHIPAVASTLHRLLGSRPGSRRFRHDARHPLPLDVLVIDEASMIDLSLMAATLAALPVHARLYLLGDKDQLASVEAGAILGQLGRHAQLGRYTPETAAWLKEAAATSLPENLIDPAGTPLDQAVCMLRHSHRFSAGGGIGQLAEAINLGEFTQLPKFFAEKIGQLRHLTLDTPNDLAFLDLCCEELASRYRHLHETPPLEATARDEWASAILAAMGEFQVLAALRNGPWGVAGLNQLLEQALRARGLIGPTGTWFAGRPVLVTQNDYGLGLMNGDIGLTLPYREDNGSVSLRVAFPRHAEGGIHWLLPSRLRAVETVFALTVHKSQGSEFKHVLLVLPPRRQPVVTRELIYTGVTRAQSRFTLVSGNDSAVLEAAIRQKTQRASGLFSN